MQIPECCSCLGPLGMIGNVCAEFDNKKNGADFLALLVDYPGLQVSESH